MKYSEMTKEEIRQRIRSGPRFTTEEMSVQDAIDLFKPDEKGGIYKSYVLLESVVPEEYMDNKEFFMGIIPTRYPFSYSSVLAYASTRLKNDKELVSFAVKHHGYSAVYALISNVEVDNFELLKQYKKDKTNVYITPVCNLDGETVRFEAKSKLLQDKEYWQTELANQEDPTLMVGTLIEKSEECASDKNFVMNALDYEIGDYYFARFIDEQLLQDKEVVVKLIEKMFEAKSYRSIASLKTKNGKVKISSFEKLIKICSKLDELPSDAKVRKFIYQKLAKHYLEAIKIKEDGVTV